MMKVDIGKMSKDAMLQTLKKEKGVINQEKHVASTTWKR